VEDHNPILASSVLINSFGSPRLRKVRWDYEEESPLRDARGFERPSLEPLEDEGGLVSVILDNGARYYVDHAHPEYSTPECTNARHNVAFQLSQRADFFEVEVGLETTFKRPIINTRDEPHADPEKYRRLHVIIGDANMSEVATFLKTGTTALILKMIEDDFISADLTLAEPVAAL